jgi:predicted PhzF superfamily epimerase YddE/YHI9
VLEADRLVAVLDSSESVRTLCPDIDAVARLPLPGQCVTARGDGVDSDVDFVSRYFAPAKDIREDPVTGSAHAAIDSPGRARTSAQSCSQAESSCAAVRRFCGELGAGGR